MDLAIYDMDRTVTRRATYTPFLLHCALRRAPWRLVFLPIVVGSMLAGGDSIDDTARLRAGAAVELFDDTRAPSTVGSSPVASWRSRSRPAAPTDGSRSS